jgi:hypothetical protein
VKRKKASPHIPDEDLWVYFRGSPDLVNNLLNSPFPPQEWLHHGERLQRELLKRAKDHGTSPEKARHIAARAELFLAIKNGLVVEASGDLDEDQAKLKRDLRKAISHPLVKELLGEYWRPKASSDSAPKSVDTADCGTENELDIYELLEEARLSESQDKLVDQILSDLYIDEDKRPNIAKASRRINLDPSTGRTHFQRIRKTVRKAVTAKREQSTSKRWRKRKPERPKR